MSKAGLLRRKGHSFPYNWSGRRFVLTDAKLERFDPKTGASKGSIVFGSQAACSVRSAAEANVFIVVCSAGQETRLKADSAADRAAWVADINRRIDKPAIGQATVDGDKAALGARYAPLPGCYEMAIIMEGYTAAH